MNAPPDLLDVLECLDLATREVLGKLGSVQAEPCAAGSTRLGQRAVRELGRDSRLVFEVEPDSGLCLEQVCSELIERVTALIGEPGPRAQEPDRAEACLAGRLDYLLEGGDRAGVRAALELWLKAPLCKSA